MILILAILIVLSYWIAVSTALIGLCVKFGALLGDNVNGEDPHNAEDKEAWRRSGSLNKDPYIGKPPLHFYASHKYELTYFPRPPRGEHSWRVPEKHPCCLNDDRTRAILARFDTDELAGERGQINGNHLAVLSKIFHQNLPLKLDPRRTL